MDGTNHMDPITINRVGHIHQQEILNSAAPQGERELQPWLLALRNVVGAIWQQTNTVAERIEATTAEIPRARNQQGCEGLQS